MILFLSSSVIMDNDDENHGLESWTKIFDVGCGSFGQVFVAINHEPNYLFAIKSVQIDHTKMGQSRLKALENEQKILQSLDCPHVIQCLGGNTTKKKNGTFKIVFLEYMVYGSLADFMKKAKGPFNEDFVRLYTKDMLLGLQYIHKMGIIHCDIKGNNVLLGTSGAKLADFGLAIRIGPDAEKCESATFRGTQLWMAPEVLNKREQGFPSDIWSLGCTVMELLTGDMPWTHTGTHVHHVIECIRAGRMPKFPSCPCISAVGRDFIEKCLKFNADDRWSSFQLLQHAFVRDSITPSSTGKTFMEERIKSSCKVALSYDIEEDKESKQALKKQRIEFVG
ncbi:hypothetical protein O6H91_16G031300 [Diphasiastrum complanatum]|uniref:Uncharacterized protein n=1 Tax=Diphasiastrum complanatum TaxID=34168 RepID=A0ACC2BB40_DIPCM|nr:hypothetical protein O6H91_16G031300 [Diphasiastrum complanatum]